VSNLPLVLNSQSVVGDSRGPRRFPLLAGAVIALACVWAIYVHLAVRILPFDDAYITFRYVENTVAGNGPVYNIGQRVFGVSTPLYFAWLVFLKIIFHSVDLPTLAVRTNCVWFILTGFGAFFLVRRCTSHYGLATAAAATLLLSRQMLEVSTGGMEPFMFLSCVIFALIAASLRRPLLFGILLGLAVLCRLEGICLVPVGFLVFGKSWRDLFWIMVISASLILLWLVPATIYFGTPIPHSIIAKSKPMYILPRTQGLVSLTWYMSASFVFANKWIGYCLISIEFAGVMVCYGIKECRQRVAYGAGLFFCTIFCMYIAGNPLFFPWYEPPFFASGLIGFLITAHALLRHFGGLKSTALPGQNSNFAMVLAKRIAMLIGIILMVHITVGPYRKGHINFSTPMTDVAADPARLRAQAYRKCAAIINGLEKSGDRVALPEIGGFGYYYKGWVLDSCGLVSPEALPFLPTDGGKIPISFVMATKPEWVVSIPSFAADTLFNMPWFKDHYELVQSVPLEISLWGSDAVLIYRSKASFSEALH
jgi:hypothetical protein